MAVILSRYYKEWSQKNVHFKNLAGPYLSSRVPDIKNSCGGLLDFPLHSTPTQHKISCAELDPSEVLALALSIALSAAIYSHDLELPNFGDGAYRCRCPCVDGRMNDPIMCAQTDKSGNLI